MSFKPLMSVIEYNEIKLFSSEFVMFIIIVYLFLLGRFEAANQLGITEEILAFIINVYR